LCCMIFIFLGCNWPFQKNEWSIAFTGDILLDRGIRRQVRINGISGILSNIQPVLRKSIFIVGNLENPLTTINNPQKKKYVFKADPAWAKGLREAGFTHFDIANNHTFDQGESGFLETITTLKNVNIEPVGICKRSRYINPVLLANRGDTCLLIASNFISPEPQEQLPDSIGPARNTVDELSEIIYKEHTAHRKYFIVVLLHWGREHNATVTDEQKNLAHLLIDSGADAIIGHHPHILQPIELYKNKAVIYSLGNLVFDQERPSATKAMIVRMIIYNHQNIRFVLYPVELSYGIPSLSDKNEIIEKIVHRGQTIFF
jgi:poly-gamma-glutamate capsule biosynthesis protein CapA/YwtB (metallophosphatase superfamily)